MSRLRKVYEYRPPEIGNTSLLLCPKSLPLLHLTFFNAHPSASIAQSKFIYDVFLSSDGYITSFQNIYGYEGNILEEKNITFANFAQVLFSINFWCVTFLGQ